MTTSNVRHLKLCQPNPARIEADLRERHKRDPLLYGIGLVIAMFTGLIALAIYFASLEAKQKPWACPDDSSAAVAGYFERCVNQWGPQNRSECLEDARTLYCQKLP